MYKILLATHGDMCVGMLETAKIFSNDVSNVTAIPFYSENKEFNPDDELDTFIQNIKEEDMVVVLSDILWGSVNQKLYLGLNDKANVHVITGLNLPLLLEFLTINPSDITQSLVSSKVASCRESIIYMKEYQIMTNENDE